MNHPYPINTKVMFKEYGGKILHGYVIEVDQKLNEELGIKFYYRISVKYSAYWVSEEVVKSINEIRRDKINNFLKNE